MKPRYRSATDVLCKGLTRHALRLLPVSEQQHFTLCRKCGRYFDMRKLEQAVAHSFLDHDACTPAARQYAGIHGKPVKITKFQVRLRDGRVMDGTEYDAMRRSRKRI